MIRVFLVDDHPVVRAGIRFLLEAKGPVQVVGEAESGEEALEKIPLLKPEVAVLDLSLPGMSGIETAKALKNRTPEVRLVALSMHEDPEYVQSFFEAGGQGYVPKSAVEAELVDAVLAVVRGEYYAPPRLLSRVAREMAKPQAHEAKLTERELEVVRQIAEGKTYKEIAEHLGISEKTVATYRERAAEKLGLRTRAELVRWALERGLLA